MNGLILQIIHTIFDSDASLFEKGIAAFNLATGFGDEAKWLAKTVGVSDAIVDGTRVVDGIKFKSFIEYNKAWKQFFKDNPNPTIDQLFNQAKILMMEIYGTEVF